MRNRREAARFGSAPGLARALARGAAPPEAIRQAATCNDLPVGQITEVSVLDPHCYH